ncbi:MAG: hypothetical protein M0D53_01910 [Flavobacterium sp. JAD_PAG50586_2]|nr:MAG: hypothetical protein M0D53_01910 [Flavobacterium sp. JAD_PAG50586_2]
MKKILLLSFFFCFSSFAQNNVFYFVRGTDTIYAKQISYNLTIQSYLSSINYTDMDGKTVELKGKKNLADVTSFYIGGSTIDRIPQKASKPKSYVKWATRVVDGKLKVNYYYNEMRVNNMSTGFMGGGTTTSSITKFFIRMPDGTFYDIRKSGDRKKYIIPYLKQCDAFNSAYKGNFDSSYEEFTKTITLYNSLCK